ncbi:hypothetical protein ACGFSB_21155 [Streptomyces sp. NPDC048441]|uniref:hypothetical protein n=1 Tax=Streptomyces sp. NPDC048441 TaxID=3365552 RepID=UPI00371A9950
MSRQRKYVTTTLVSLSLVAGGALVTAPQAQASGVHGLRCGKEWLKELDTSGENIDIEYANCIGWTKTRFRAEGYGRVLDGGGSRKVDAFIVEMRVDRGNVTIQRSRCNFTKAINTHDGVNTDCNSKAVIGRKGLTGDSRIYIDLDSDGRGGKWYNLAGSGRA